MKIHRLNSAVLIFCGTVFLTFFSFFHPSYGQPPEIPVVVAASATSYGEESQSIVCLLDSKCEGSWMPQSKDGGKNEGIYIQFLKPVPMGYILIEVEDTRSISEVKTYFDGSLLQKERAEVIKNAQKSNTSQSNDEEKDSEESVEALPVNGRIVTDNHKKSFILIGRGLREELFPIKYSAKSLFLSLSSSTEKPVKIRSIRFIDALTTSQFSSEMSEEDIEENNKVENQNSDIRLHIQLNSDLPILPLELPLVSLASVNATSVLEPAFAYNASHLFDSQFDLAWSTNGKKGNGIKESVSVLFESEQKISGLMVWNGYQRSDIHYAANGRVRSLDINGVVVPLADKPGMQQVMLSKPIQGKNIKLTVLDIYQGGSYKDVLLSELRFITSDGRILLPQVTNSAPQNPSWVEPLIDRTYVSFIQGFSLTDEPWGQCYRSEFRLRSNGSFVIYTGAEYASDTNPGVLEGNWELVGKNLLRVFGKKYGISINIRDGYLNVTEETEEYKKTDAYKNTVPRIFQSRVSMTAFNELSANEKKSIIRFIIEKRKSDSEREGGITDKQLILTLNKEAYPKLAPVKEFNEVGIVAKTVDEYVQAMVIVANIVNPLVIKSDVYTEILAPSNSVTRCNNSS